VEAMPILPKHFCWQREKEQACKAPFSHTEEFFSFDAEKWVLWVAVFAGSS
jgi:hypothetical protein